MRKLKKKGAFDTINAGMIAFISFVLIVVITLLMISTFKSSDMICSTDEPNVSVAYDSGNCLACVKTGNYTFEYNASDALCHNQSNRSATKPTIQFFGAAYNSTKNLQEAAFLPPQFAQIVVIVVIIVGILSLLGAIGLGVYSKMRN